MTAAVCPAESLSSLEAIDLAIARVDPKWSHSLPAAAARRLRVIALCQVQGDVIVATSNPRVASVREFVTQELGVPYRLVRAEEAPLRRLFSRSQPRINPPQSHSSSHRCEVVDLCDELQDAAILRGASDIHLVPDETALQVSFRVDGILEHFQTLPIATHAGLVNRIKVLSGLDIAEKRQPQDGRFTIQRSPASQRTDVRVATIPTRFGERIALRLLCPPQTESLLGLGMRAAEFDSFHQAIHASSGLVLLTGPTGSGKSTTLFTAIRQLQKSRGGNIITVEDPIEYEIPGTSQIEVDATSKISFPGALRSILRHDPDIIMLGEIRDAETAALAIKAALTGHLVLSTLHTNTAAGAVTRLIDMGVEPFLIAATLRLAVAQRLVRKLCDHCKQPTVLEYAEASALGQPDLTGQTTYTAPGCVACSGKGFVGRVALFEMLRGGHEVSERITAGASEASLVEHMQQSQHSLLIEDGIQKILSGTTTAQQVLRGVAAW